MNHTGGKFAINAYLFYFKDLNATLAIAFNGTSLKDFSSDSKEVLSMALMRLMFE